jgi:hypothetical protein
MLSWKDVSAALENNKYIWRTLRGVAKELKTTQEEVLQIITENASEVIKSSVPANTGENLYTTRKHYRRKASFFDKITSSMTSTVSPSAAPKEED